MMFWQQVYGIFRKELSLQSRHRLVILNRLLLGPLISGVTAALLYSGFFRSGPNVTVGGLNSNTVGIHLLFGLLIHACLNNGYYYFSLKLISELAEGTLPLLWIGSCSPLALFLGLGSIEALRCLFLSLIAFSVLCYWRTPSVIASGGCLLIVCLVSLIGTCLGFLRSCLGVLCEASELLDHGYMAFIFLACLYIPKSILPALIQPFCEWNPAYHASLMMKGLWLEQSAAWQHLAPLVGGTLLIVGLTIAFWLHFRVALKEQAFT